MLSTHTPEFEHAAQAPAEADSSLTYCLVHGSWHGAWCWDLLTPRLEAYGHHTIAVDLPIDHAYATVEDWKDEVCRVIDDAPNTVVVGHSRMSNLLPRVARELDIRQAVYINPGFDSTNNGYFQRNGFGPLPRKYWLEGFHENIMDHPANAELKIFNPERVKQVFYNDCLPEVADWAAESLRPMYRPETIDPVEAWPEVPSAVIVGDSDRVINPEYSRYVAKSIGARIVEMSGGHSLFISQPERVAQTLHKLALCNTVNVEAC